MSRLIDADALMEYTLNLKGKMISCNDIARFPTAYDTDKVIEQLKKLIDDKVGFLRSTPEANCYIQAINDAIEIVKRGGVEE